GVAMRPPASDVPPAILPGVEHLMEFHGVVNGSCWTAIVGEEPLRLEEGDLVLFPQGDAHVVSSAPGMRSQVPNRGLRFTPRPPQLPYALTYSGNADVGATTAHLDGGGREQTKVICGFLGCDARPFNPLLASLPRVLRIPAAEGSPWIESFMRSVVEESNRKRPGGEAVLERMSEMLFVEALRSHVDRLSPDQTGWLAGMRDPAVG